MSTETSSSAHGYVPAKTLLENCSIEQIIQELTLRLLGPEKAKLLKGSGINLTALSAALMNTQFLPGSVPVKDGYGIPTPYPHYGSQELRRDWWKDFPGATIVCTNQPPEYGNLQVTKSTGTLGLQ